jgi:hypothetical protein
MLGTVLIVLLVLVSRVRPPDVESQPFLGLLPERWIRSTACSSGGFAAAWPDLAESCGSV